MIRARQEGRSEEAADRRDERGAPARLRRFRHRLRQLRQHAQPREPQAVRRDLGRRCARRAWSQSATSTQLFDPKAGTFLADRFVKGTCPNCGSPDQYGDNCDKCGSTYSPTELIDPSARSAARRRSCAARRICSCEIEAAARFLDEWTQIGRAPAAGDRQLSEGPLPRRAAARLGRLAAGAVLRLRDSRQPGQLLVRLVRRADRLHGLDAAVVRTRRARSSTTGGSSNDVRDPPLHRQGHHVLPHAVLAGMLKTAGFSAAERKCTSTAS